MTSASYPTFGSVLRTTLAATAAIFATVPTAFAGDYAIGLKDFLAEPTDFVALSDGAPGTVTYASMENDTLVVQYMIPTHAGDAFGEVVGKVDASGVFTGHGILIGESGKGQSSSVTMNFQSDGMIVASSDTGMNDSAFIKKAAFYGN